MAKVVDPVSHYDATRVHLLHHAEEGSVYRDFYDEVVKRISDIDPRIEVVPHLCAVYEFSEVMREVLCIMQDEANRCGDDLDIYVNISAGTSEYSAAALIASMMNTGTAVPFTVGAEEFQVPPEKVREVYYDGDRPVGLTKTTKEPKAVSAYPIESPDPVRVLALKVLDEQIGRDDTCASTMMRLLNEKGLFGDYEKRPTDRPEQKEVMRYQRNFVDYWLEKGWVEKVSKRRSRVTKRGRDVLDVFYDSYSRKLDIAALVDLDYTLRQSDNIGLTVFFARNAKSTFLDRQGQDLQESYDLMGINQVSHFYTLQNYQLSGHHEADSWLIDWGASYSRTSSDEPDRRQVMFSKGDDGLLSFFDLNQQETQRYFGRLGENEIVADIKATWNIDDRDRLRFGLTGKDKTRTFRTTRFYYNVRGIGDRFPVDERFDMDSYLNFGNIQSGLVSISRVQSPRDRYDASNLTGAAFVETDLHFGKKWSLNAGLRFEASRQSVDYNDDVEDKTRNLDSFDLFPAVNLKFDMTDRSMFRFSLSRTVTRPSFIEMAPFLYQESFGGAMIRGNDGLENGYNYNLDIKYEFFARETTDMFAVTAYMKYLDNPIERTQRVSGGATEHSFQNADNGLAAGLEVEFRKEIVRDLALNVNASYMYTNVILPEGGVYTNPQRSLQGASPYLANADITYTPKFKNGDGLNLSLLYNLQGPRIHAVGIMGLGDVKQLPVHTLDFSGSYEFNDRFSISLSFRNLLDSTIRFRQDIPNAGRSVMVEQWRVGPAFEIGFSYSL